MKQLVESHCNFILRPYVTHKTYKDYLRVLRRIRLGLLDEPMDDSKNRETMLVWMVHCMATYTPKQLRKVHIGDYLSVKYWWPEHRHKLQGLQYDTILKIARDLNVNEIWTTTFDEYMEDKWEERQITVSLPFCLFELIRGLLLLFTQIHV